jgi:hypothetical protein
MNILILFNKIYCFYWIATQMSRVGRLAERRAKMKPLERMLPHIGFQMIGVVLGAGLQGRLPLGARSRVHGTRSDNGKLVVLGTGPV